MYEIRKSKMSTFYGDIYTWFTATVTEAGYCDPLDLGRVKVRCDGVHGTNIKNSDLPLAQCVLPTTGAGTSGFGENPRLEANARVCGYFIDGNSCQLPIIIGCIPHYGQPNLRQLDNQVTSNEATFTAFRPTTSSFATGASIETTVVGNSRTNPEIAWDFFSTTPGLSNEYEPYQIAGMIGNFMVESKNLGPPLRENGLRDPTGEDIPSNYKRFYIQMDPNAKGDFDKETKLYTAIGIAQWTKERQENLLNYADRHGHPASGLDPFDLITQLKFVDWALKNDSKLRRSLFVTNNVEEATMMFMREYERPRIEGAKSTPQVYSRLVNGDDANTGYGPMAKFGYPRGYFHTRAGEKERLKQALGILKRFSQTISSTGTG